VIVEEAPEESLVGGSGVTHTQMTYGVPGGFNRLSP
jgi:hypothetical protein